MKKLTFLIVFYSIILLSSCQNATKDPDMLKSEYDKVMEAKKDTVLYTEVDNKLYVVKKDKVLLKADKEINSGATWFLIIIILLFVLLIFIASL